MFKVVTVWNSVESFCVFYFFCPRFWPDLVVFLLVLSAWRLRSKSPRRNSRRVLTRATCRCSRRCPACGALPQNLRWYYDEELPISAGFVRRCGSVANYLLTRAIGRDGVMSGCFYFSESVYVLPHTVAALKHDSKQGGRHLIWSE